jgi:2-polyprenyl-3-methyl-5-hydroxy-6-metoxy-1,4-benzoquinol methylase
VAIPPRMTSPLEPSSTGSAESHWSAFDAIGMQRLVTAEAHHFWFRARNEILAALIEGPMRDLPDGFRVLELGCGSGNVLRVMQRLAAGRGTVEGLEVSSQAAEIARRRTGLQVSTGRLSEVDPTRSFDIIAAFDVLEHIADVPRVLEQVRARLRRNGRLIVSVPALQSLWSSFDVASGHERRYSLPLLTRTLRAAGFDVEYRTYFFSLLYPAMWLRHRLIRTHVDDLGSLLDSQFRVVPGVNQLAYEVLRQEAHLIRGRRRLPIGTSIAAIAVPTEH